MNNQERVATDTDLDVLTRISDYVDKYAVETPDAEAAVFQGDRVTYAELKRRIDACARALLASGIGKGDRVAMLCTPRTEFWVVFLATTGIGAVWVGLNPKYRLDEFRHVVDDSKPRLLFALAEFEGRQYAPDITALKAENPELETVIAITGSIDAALPFGEFVRRAERASEGEYEAACRAVERMDLALIVYTSGTTGKPKGAMLTHYGLTYGATIQTLHFKVANPIIVVSFPINHVALVADTCATTLVKGGKIVFQERFDPGATLAAVEEEQCTLWGGVPTMLQLQLAHPEFEQRNFSSVELVLWGGAAMPRDGIVRLQQTGARLMAAYGMTETSAHTTYTEPDASLDVLAETVGKPDPRCPCRIVNESGEVCGVGESGELQFHGELMMLGYWNRPEATDDAFTEDGWLRTGDTGFWREDGNIELVGRLSEMFKSGGYNVYPREIELTLEQLPAVAMAAVIGVPDQLYQEVGHAYVLLEPDQSVTEDELRAHCKEHLANYKVPKRFFTRAELPMLAVGKVDKQVLKRASQDR